MEFIQSNASVFHICVPICEWGYCMNDLVDIQKHCKNSALAFVHYMNVVIFGVWALGFSEIINMNPATKSKRQACDTRSSHRQAGLNAPHFLM